VLHQQLDDCAKHISLLRTPSEPMGTLSGARKPTMWCSLPSPRCVWWLCGNGLGRAAAPRTGLRLGLQVVRGKSRLPCGCLAVIGRPKMPGALRPTKDLAAPFILLFYSALLFCTLPREPDRSAGSCRLARGIQNAHYCDICIQRREPGWLNFSGDDGN
jgi:hypothetical protein